MTRPSSRHLVLAAFAAVYLLWGSTYLAFRYTVEEIPPFVAVTVRCLLGAAILFGWLAARGRLQRATTRQWAAATLAGGLLFVSGQGVLAWAEQRVPSGSAALLLATIPLWMVLLDSIRSRRLPGQHVVAGTVLGMAGVAVLSGRAGGAPLTEQLLLLMAALAWALGSLVARQRLSGVPAFQSTAMQLAGGGVVLALVSGASGELAAWSPGMVTARAVGALAYLVIGGTVIGFVAYTWLLRVTTLEAVGTYAFVNPVVALALAWAVGDQAMTPVTALAGVLIIGSVLLIRRRPSAGPAGALRGRSADGLRSGVTLSPRAAGAGKQGAGGSSGVLRPADSAEGGRRARCA
jgi:drug/metabolite transporter (DMT)-like permease